jgi:phage shock protein PspC (stress-responsive transcriptional regulator)
MPDVPAGSDAHDGGMSTDTSMHQERRGYPPLSDLRRSRSDRKLAGVSGGLGHWAGVDPLVFRILFVVLTVFGGSGLLLYALGWLLVPEDGEAESEGQRLFNGRSTTSWKGLLALVVVILLGIAATATLIGSGPGIGGIGVLAVIGVVAVFLLRNGPGPRNVGAPAGTAPDAGPVHGPVPPPAEPGAFGQTPGTAYSAPVTPAASTEAPPAYAAAPPAPQTATFSAPPQTAPYPPPAGPSGPTYPVYGPPQPPAPPKERSILGRVTLSVALIVVGVMVGVNTGTSDDIPARVIFASALLVVGLGLLVGSFIGRARGLVVWGVLLTMLAGAAAVVGDTSLRGGVGDRTWRPATVADLRPTYRLGIGEAELDLSRLDVTSAAGVEHVKVREGIGDLTVIVPEGVVVRVDADVNAGEIRLPDEFEPVDGTDLHENVVLPAGSSAGSAQLVIDADLGLGSLEVRYASA